VITSENKHYRYFDCVNYLLNAC